MIKWQAHVIHMAKYINVVGGPLLMRGSGPGPLGTPLNPALLWCFSNKWRSNTKRDKTSCLSIYYRILTITSIKTDFAKSKETENRRVLRSEKQHYKPFSSLRKTANP